jgi:hypothetical protein
MAIHIVAYRGTAQGATFEELQKSAESLGANAILNTCFDDALGVDTLFHGAAVVIEPIPVSLQHLAGGTPVYSVGEPTDLNQEAALSTLRAVNH